MAKAKGRRKGELYGSKEDFERGELEFRFFTEVKWREKKIIIRTNNIHAQDVLKVMEEHAASGTIELNGVKIEFRIDIFYKMLTVEVPEAIDIRASYKEIIDALFKYTKLHYGKAFQDEFKKGLGEAIRNDGNMSDVRFTVKPTDVCQDRQSSSVFYDKEGETTPLVLQYKFVEERAGIPVSFYVNYWSCSRTARMEKIESDNAYEFIHDGLGSFIEGSCTDDKITINYVYMGDTTGYCTNAVSYLLHVLLAESKKMGIPHIPYIGGVQIVSYHPCRAFSCYRNAFENNGFTVNRKEEATFKKKQEENWNGKSRFSFEFHKFFNARNATQQEMELWSLLNGPGALPAGPERDKAEEKYRKIQKLKTEAAAQTALGIRPRQSGAGAGAGPSSRPRRRLLFTLIDLKF